MLLSKIEKQPVTDKLTLLFNNFKPNSRKDLEKRIRKYAPKSSSEISERIIELESEIPAESFIEKKALLFSLGGIVLGSLSKKWLFFPAVILSVLYRNDLKVQNNTGLLFRKLGLRSRKEIECEKNALKILRGDYDVFSGFSTAGGLSRLDQALLSIEL